MNKNKALQQKNKAKKTGEIVLHWFEIGLGIITLAAVLIFTVYQIINIGSFDWSSIETYTQILKIILELAIGIEVARMLFSYNIDTLIELAVFIVIRKMLLIDGAFVDLLLGVISLVILFAARYFFVRAETGKSAFSIRNKEE